MLHRIVSEIRYRLRAVAKRADMDRELDAELQFHLAREIEKHVAAGMTRPDAERRARLTLGGIRRVTQETRDARGVAWIDHAMQDMRYAIRALRARKAFTAGVVLTLGLGIGANATMFGIVDRLLYRAPPMLRDPSTVHRVYLSSMNEGELRTERNLAFRTYLDITRTSHSFSGIAAFQTRTMAIGDGQDARERLVTVASASYFGFFDARPAIGRFFGATEDSAPSGAPVVVLGHAFWQASFGGRDVIGESLRVGSTLATIIGVAPEHFVGMSDQGVPAAYIPVTNFAFSVRGAEYTTIYTWSWLEFVVRRRPDVSVAAAESDLTAVFQQSWRNAEAMMPGWGPVERARLRTELGPVQLGRGPQAAPESRVATWIGGVAIIVLLIACANVANLLLSRAVSRRREIAVRLALGVSRGRLVRQLLTESVVLAVLGSVTGLAIAQWGASGLRAWFLPAGLEAGVITDTRTLTLTLIATIAVALLTGLVPALHAGRSDVAAALKTGAREGGSHRSRTRTALLVAQAALSVVLLVGAGLFVRSLQNVLGYRLGYDAESVLYTTVTSRGANLTGSELRSLNDRMLAAALSLPGVTNATPSASVPFWSNEGRPLIVPGVDSVRSRGRFILQAGSPDYFATMGTRILRGRAFDATDRETTQRVAVVSEGMARVLWPGQEAIGKCFKLNSDTMPCISVVGIAEEMRVRSMTDAREFVYYLPASQYDRPMDPDLLVRVTGDASTHVETLRRRLQAELSGAAYVNVLPLTALVDPNLRSWRFGATMFVAFGVLALVLSGIGLYSMIAYDVAQRTRELGVRIALGAQFSRVVRMIVFRGVRLVVVGVVAGTAIAAWGAPRLQSLMFNQSARDPVVFGAIIAVLLLASVVATAAPAMRAAKVNPNVALRDD